MGIGAGAATAIGIGAAVASAAGAAAGAVGSIQQGNYAAQVAKNNATIAKQSATYSAQAGQVAAENQSMQNASQLGQLKANQAANNVDINSGSALQVQTGEEAAGELNTQTTLHNALLQAYGYQNQGTSQTAQAQQDTTAGYEEAGAGLLGSVSSLGLKWSGGAGSGGSGITADGGNTGWVTNPS
jgi:hypothetical protein